MRSGFFSSCAVLVGTAVTVQGMAFKGPRATDIAVIPTNARSPKPTSPARLPDRIFRRQDDDNSTTVYIAPDNTCGYISGRPGAEFTCNNAADYCVLATAPGYIACCSPDFSDCGANIICYDSVQVYSESLCDDLCMQDTYTAKCTDSANPYCNTLVFLNTITDYYCGSLNISTAQLAETTWVGETGRTLSPLVLTSTSTTTGGSSSSSSSSSVASSSSSSSSSSSGTGASTAPTSASSGSSGSGSGSGSGGSNNSSGGSSTPVGAIVGGVVGGVAALGLIILGIVFLLRRGGGAKAKADAANTTNQPAQGGDNGAPPPPGQPGSPPPPPQVSETGTYYDPTKVAQQQAAFVPQYPSPPPQNGQGYPPPQMSPDGKTYYSGVSPASTTPSQQPQQQYQYAQYAPQQPAVHEAGGNALGGPQDWNANHHGEISELDSGR